MGEITDNHRYNDEWDIHIHRPRMFGRLSTIDGQNSGDEENFGHSGLNRGSYSTS